MIGRSIAVQFLLAVSSLGAYAQTGGDQPASATESVTPGFPAGKTAVQTPFELLGNAIYVSARMNGRGPFLFVLDTGSCCSVLASELADQLGVNPQGEMKGTGAGSSSNKMGLVKGKIEFAFAGGLTLSTEDANTLSLAGAWPLIGRPFYGIVGYDVLKDVVVQIDYDKRIVTFYSPATYKYSGKGEAFKTKLEMDYDPQFAGAFTVTGLKPVSTVFTIDTGAGGTIINAPLVKANHLIEQVREKLPSPSHGAGEGQSDDLAGRIASIRLGPYELERPLVALSQDTDGSLAMESIGVNLGGNLLRRFTVTIDYPGGTVVLEPNSHFADPFPADASGLVLSAEGDDFRTFVVRGIVAGSPAAGAGMKVGDIVTAIDGEPVKQFALWEVQDLLKNSGHSVKLSVRRSSRFLTCELSLRSLV
ncbi:MAG TPA: aspartyl protease family protein [Terracidiphilus sp.]|jgi:hypothetical protein